MKEKELKNLARRCSGTVRFVADEVLHYAVNLDERHNEIVRRKVDAVAKCLDTAAEIHADVYEEDRTPSMKDLESLQETALRLDRLTRKIDLLLEVVGAPQFDVARYRQMLDTVYSLLEAVIEESYQP